jgi:hypothetical protein
MAATAVVPNKKGNSQRPPNEGEAWLGAAAGGREEIAGRVGTPVGAAVGIAVGAGGSGAAGGAAVGMAVGAVSGAAVGAAVGAVSGAAVGAAVGAVSGAAVGAAVGAAAVAGSGGASVSAGAGVRVHVIHALGAAPRAVPASAVVFSACAPPSMSPKAPAPWCGFAGSQLVVGPDSASPPFWKNAAPGPAVGAAVASAPFAKYSAAPRASSCWLAGGCVALWSA